MRLTTKNVIAFFSALIIFYSANAACPSSKYYQRACNEISDMLEGKAELSIKRAVFLLEWAYLDGNLDYQNYCLQIDTTTQAIRRFIEANHLDRYKTGGNFALFEYFSRPYSINGYKPFTYDFEDFAGSEDFTKLFVTKVMRTHSGQCRSLPMYYKVLAEAIGAQAHITFAPQHLFIRHRDEQDPNKWVNVELTTQSLSREIFYIENFGISGDAIRNKIYLYPLSDRETVAYLLSEMAEGYYRKYKTWDTFMLQCAEKSLEYYPQNTMALQQKGNVLNTKLIDYLRQNGHQMDEQAKSLDRQWMENNDALRRLGFTEMPATIYEGLLKGVQSDMKRHGLDSITIKSTTDKIRQADRMNN